MKKKRLDLRSFVSSGGMPSSHTALVVALTTRVGLIEGIDSTFFAISLVFSLIVMYDAAGVRRAVGIQAQKLNELLDNFYDTHRINNRKLREILGHTPLEVLGGLILGLLIGLFW